MIHRRAVQHAAGNPGAGAEIAGVQLRGEKQIVIERRYVSVRSAPPEIGIVPARGSVSDTGVPRFSPEAYRSRFATPSSAGAERSSLRSGSVNSAAVKFCPCHSA